MENFTGKTIGTEQEMKDCFVYIVYESEVENPDLMDSHLGYVAYGNEEIMDVTGDMHCACPEGNIPEWKKCVVFTPELKTVRTGVYDDDGWEKRKNGTRKLVQYFFEHNEEEISDREIDLGGSYKFIVDDGKKFIIYLPSSKVRFANQITIGYTFDQMKQEISDPSSELHKCSDIWYTDQYENEAGELTGDGKFVYNLIISILEYSIWTNYMEDVTIFRDKTIHFYEPVNPNVKNSWRVLPRTTIADLLMSVSGASEDNFTNIKEQIKLHKPQFKKIKCLIESDKILKMKALIKVSDGDTEEKQEKFFRRLNSIYYEFLINHLSQYLDTVWEKKIQQSDELETVDNLIKHGNLKADCKIYGQEVFLFEYRTEADLLNIYAEPAKKADAFLCPCIIEELPK